MHLSLYARGFCIRKESGEPRLLSPALTPFLTPESTKGDHGTLIDLPLSHFRISFSYSSRKYSLREERIILPHTRQPPLSPHGPLRLPPYLVLPLHIILDDP